MEDLRAITSQESGIEAWKKRAEGVPFPFFLSEKEKKQLKKKEGMNLSRFNLFLSSS
jgi:hypothetical protein